MKAEIVNCFIEGLHNTMNTNGGFTLVNTERFAVHEVELRDELAISVNIAGNNTVQGKLVITMESALALKIISTMLGGMVVDQIDDMGKSAIEEYTNWITAASATLVEKKGEKIANFELEVLAPGEKDSVQPPSGSKFLGMAYSVSGSSLKLHMAI